MGDISFENIRITAAECNVDFNQARRLAEEVIADMVRMPTLVAWFDGKKGVEHPVAQENQQETGWLAYAAGHNGRVRVDINEDEYSFIFSDTAM